MHSPSMFVLVGRYLKPEREIAATLPEHVAWLRARYGEGRFLGSGRQVPPVGGLILARAADRAEMNRIAEADPFVVKGLASYEIVEFVPGPHCSEHLRSFMASAVRDGSQTIGAVDDGEK